MRIVVNDIAATPDAGGVFTILRNFYNSVLNDDKNEWFFILSGKYFEEKNNVKIIVRQDLKKSKIKKFFFESIFGSYFINKLNPDIYISLQNIATIGVKSPYKFVYLHQAIPFQNEKNFSFFDKKERKLAFYQKIVGNVIKRTIKIERPYVIVQTKWMRNSLLNKKIISNPKILVHKPIIPLKIGNEIYTGAGKSFIYPATPFIYKNHVLIYKAVEELNEFGVDNFNVELTISSKKKVNNVSFIGHITYDEVMQKYNKSVLIFPSYIESFGLPLIEAASKADIILAADTEFARELLNGYGNVYYYRSDDYNRLAHLMKKVIDGEIVSNKKKLEVTGDSQPLARYIITSVEKLQNVKDKRK